MRFFILAVILFIAFSNSAFAQIKNPFADVLTTPAEIKLVDSDDRETTLLKQSFNAAHNEMRIRYNYWLQDIGDIDGLLHSIDRLHEIRLAIGPATSELEFVEQKLAFAKELETHCEKANSKAKFEAVRQINEASAKAFRICAELEVARRRLMKPRSFFGIEYGVIFQIQVPQALSLFTALHGRTPRDHTEFMDKVIRKNQISLPELPNDHRYKYDAARNELLIER